MLTREEVNERLETWTLDRSQRDALQTALAAMDERDEAIQRGVSSAVALGKCQGERDALAAEGRLLREALEPAHHWLMRLVQSDNGRWVLNQRPDDADLAAMLAALSTPAPLITAEVERVRRLEAVLEAAEEYRDAEQVQMLNEFKYDEPKYERQRKAKAALDAAIAAYREREVRDMKPLAEPRTSDLQADFLDREGERPGGEV